MTQTPTRNRLPLFVIVVSLICAVIYGFVCWNSASKSDAEPTSYDYLFLALYQCLSVMSYLGALWLIGRRSTFRGLETIVVLFLVSIAGPIVPYVASCIEVWTKYQLELGWFLRHAAVAGLLHIGGMLLVMIFTYTTLFLLMLPFPSARNLAGI